MVRRAPRHLPTPLDVQSALDDARRRWAHLGARSGDDQPVAEVLAAWESINEVAEVLSGTTLDAEQRAAIYFSIYEDSARNFLFPMVASHGSMWGVTHTRRIERVVGWLVWLRLDALVRRWVEALDAVRDVNRRVFVEIYTTFYFTRYFGRHPGALEVVKPEVLALYNHVHAAIADGRRLPLEERLQLYWDVFVHEQEDIVDPGVHAAADASGSPWLVALLRHVKPRFKYFPPGERLVFTDFTSVDQRNREGLRAAKFAEQVGPERVLEALREY